MFGALCMPSTIYSLTSFSSSILKEARECFLSFSNWLHFLHERMSTTCNRTHFFFFFLNVSNIISWRNFLPNSRKKFNHFTEMGPTIENWIYYNVYRYIYWNASFFFSWTLKFNGRKMKRWKSQSKWINKWWSYGLLHTIAMNSMSALE